MADDYAIAMLKISLAQISQNVGFQGATNVSLSVLLDIYRRYMESMCNTMRRYCDHFGRSEPVLEDLEMMFGELRIPLRELSDYVTQVAPVPFKHKVPSFPVRRPSKLKIPSPDAEELKTRPDYIPPHLPLMKPEAEPTSTTTGQQQNGTVNGDHMGKSEEEMAGKLNAARISVHRATISGKQDLSSGDLIGDFSDFDAIKAGLVRIVRIPTPPPPPPPRAVSPLTISYPSAVSPTPSTSALSPTLIKQSQGALIKVAEEKGSKKKHPIVLDVRPPSATKMVPHTKLKINLQSMSAYKKKRLLMPVMAPKKEKQRFKILPPLEPGMGSRPSTSGADGAPVVPKRRGRPPGSKKLAMMAAAASTPVLSMVQMEKPPMDFSSSAENTAVVDVLASIGGSLDVSTATSSSVEDLVTSVIEETRNTIKAKEKASEHFADSVLSVISAQADTSFGESQPTRNEESIQPLAGAGSLSSILPQQGPMVVIEKLNLEQLDSRPSTSAAPPVGVPGEPSKAEKLKSILSRTRLLVNKDIIKQRLKEKSARKEAEEKKIRDVVEKTYPPIAKRQEESAAAPAPATVQPPASVSAATSVTVVVPPTQPAASTQAPSAAVSVPAPTPAPTPTPTPVSSAEPSAKPPRRPPGIPPTSLKVTTPSAKVKLEKPLVNRPSKADLAKKAELFPPLFQPEHITKTIIASSDNRKVAPLVISTKAKPTSEPSAPVTTAASSHPESGKKESTKLIIKLPHHPPSASTSANAGTMDEKERKKKHHQEKEKEKHKEKHEKKEKERPPPAVPPLTVKKEKKEPKPDLGLATSTKAVEPGDSNGVSAASSPPKGLKLKINMKSKVITPTAEKDSKGKEKKSKEPGSKTVSPQRASTMPSGVNFEDFGRNAALSPPPKSPSAHSNAPSIGGGMGASGYESPPPRTPSPGSSVPPSPIYVNTQSGEDKIVKEEVISPPAKKQKVEHRPVAVEPPPPLPRNVIKIDKSQFTSTVVPSFSQPKQQQQKQSGGDDNGWYCPVCNVPYQEGADMIACDSCDRWFHWSCVGLSQAPPEDESWFCYECRIRKASKQSSSGSQRKPSLQKTSVQKKKNK